MPALPPPPEPAAVVVAAERRQAPTPKALARLYEAARACDHGTAHVIRAQVQSAIKATRMRQAVDPADLEPTPPAPCAEESAP